jgi:hypothetical protein
MIFGWFHEIYQNQLILYFQNGKFGVYLCFRYNITIHYKKLKEKKKTQIADNAKFSKPDNY